MQTEIIITNVLPTKTAFGMLVGKAESVFIPGKVAEASNVRIGQTVSAMLVPNTHMPDRTPWLAIFIGAPKDSDPLADKIKEDLERGAATAQTVARSLGYSVESVSNKLREMSKNGGLVHDTIYALSVEDLIEEDQ